MNEVKRYDYTIVADQGGYTYIDRIEKHDGSVVEYEDWESERQARLSAETKLRELQDAISDLGYKVAVWQMYPGKTLDILSQAIQESRTRRQNDDTTI